VTPPVEAPMLGGRGATTAVLAACAGFLGLLGALPDLLGPILGVLGVVLSSVWRSRESTSPAVLATAPALAAIVVLTASAPAAASTELFAGLTGLAFLLWLADDPARPAGGGRRAGPTIAPAALAVGLAWAFALSLSGEPVEVGLAGGVLAAAIVVLAVLIAGFARAATRRGRPA